MGRRKTAQKRLQKKRPVVAKVFKCLFCNHENAVECSLNQKDKIGSLKCRICGAEWQSRIHYLTEPIDLYTEWIDVTEAENEGDGGAAEEESAARPDGDDYDALGDDYAEVHDAEDAGDEVEDVDDDDGGI